MVRDVLITKHPASQPALPESLIQDHEPTTIHPRVLMYMPFVQPPGIPMVQQAPPDLMFMHGEDYAPRSILPQMIFVIP